MMLRSSRFVVLLEILKIFPMLQIGLTTAAFEILPSGQTVSETTKQRRVTLFWKSFDPRQNRR